MKDIRFKSTDWVERGKFKTELTLDLQLNCEWGVNFLNQSVEREKFGAELSLDEHRKGEHRGVNFLDQSV